MLSLILTVCLHAFNEKQEEEMLHPRVRISHKSNMLHANSKFMDCSNKIQFFEQRKIFYAKITKGVRNYSMSFEEKKVQRVRTAVIIFQ